MIATRRIAFALPSLKVGGAERVALNLAAAFKAKGYAVDFLLMQAVGELLDEARRDFSVVDLNCNKTWKLPGRLAGYLGRAEPDALISSFWKLNLCAGLARIACPATRLALWEHSPPSRSIHSPSLIYGLTATALYPAATAVVAVSKGVADDVKSITVGLSRKMRVIYSPVPFAKPAKQRSGAGKRLVWVGRLAEPKNPDLALQSFAILNDQTATLTFIGDGPERRRLEEQARHLGAGGRVYFLGFRSDIPSLLPDYDLLVQSSDREGLPTILIEALHAGLGIVATNAGAGVSEILENGKLGRIVAPMDPALLSAAIAEELTNPIANPSAKLASVGRFEPLAIATQWESALGLA